jgi:glycerol-3-phosphate dehydrogenase
VIGSREPGRLERDQFDLVVIGGGILGAFIAWDATARGLRTALMERDDFSAGTSSASGRVLHGGLRALQHLDVSAAAESLREREIIAHLAPGLSRPLPFLFPGAAGITDQVVLRTAAAVWNSFARSALGASGSGAQFAGSRHDLDPAFSNWAPHGGLVVHDRQLISAERLVLAVLAAAVDGGAVVVNRVECQEILSSNGRVEGVQALDRESGNLFQVSAPWVLNAAGPWAVDLWPAESSARPPVSFARGIHLVADLPVPQIALGLAWTEQSVSGRVPRSRRVFVMPWAGSALIGASFEPGGLVPSGPIEPSADEILRFVTEMSRRWPGLELSMDRVRYAVAGLYPIFGRGPSNPGTFSVARRPLICDHRERGGPDGLITGISVKLTTARAVAERMVDRVAARFDRSLAPCSTATADPLPFALPSPVPGLGFGPLENPAEAARLAAAAADREQARTFADVFLRRSTIGQHGLPARDVLDGAGMALAAALEWSVERREIEIRRFEEFYDRLGLSRRVSGAPPGASD